jgi:hypothetical protein
MSSQAAVRSIDELKNFRVALALYGEDTLATLGAVEAEVRRTLRWLHEERPAYWQDQIKRRREQVALARSEVFRRNIQKRPDYNPAMSEQKEALRKAEASLHEAEKRLALVRKWRPMLDHAVLEYHASIQRLKDLAAADVPAAVHLMTRIVDALEAYLRVAPPIETALSASVGGGATASAPPRMIAIAARLVDENEAVLEAQAAVRLAAEEKARAEAEAPVEMMEIVPAEVATAPHRHLSDES